MTCTDETVERVARLAVEKGLSVAAAVSLTSGLIAQRLGAGPGQGQQPGPGPVKFEVFGVREGPVVTAECAEGLARGVARLLEADVAVAATGVGGPGPSEGKPAGTVFVAVTVDGQVTARELELAGDPGEVLADAATHALEFLLHTMATREP